MCALIKFFLIIITIGSILFGVPSHAFIGLTEDGEILYLSQIGISARYEENTPAHDKSSQPTMSVDEVIRSYISPNRDRLSSVRIIDLTLNQMTTDTLRIFVQSLEHLGLWELFKSVQIVLLSHNKITVDSASFLARFLEQNSDEKKEYPYIVITQTPSHNRHVQGLHQYLDTKPNCPHPLMSHLIFLKQNYVIPAETSTRVYSAMIREFVLPKNWVQVHKNYYHSYARKVFLRFKKNLQKREFRDFVRTCLETYSPETSKTLSEEHLTELAEYVGNLKLHSPES